MYRQSNVHFAVLHFHIYSVKNGYYASKRPITDPPVLRYGNPNRIRNGKYQLWSFIIELLVNYLGYEAFCADWRCNSNNGKKSTVDLQINRNYVVDFRCSVSLCRDNEINVIPAFAQKLQTSGRRHQTIQIIIRKICRRIFFSLFFFLLNFYASATALNVCSMLGLQSDLSKNMNEHWTVANTLHTNEQSMRC